jgi:hypothetical protein
MPLTATPVYAIAALAFYSLGWSPAWIIAATAWGLLTLCNVIELVLKEKK